VVEMFGEYSGSRWPREYVLFTRAGDTIRVMGRWIMTGTRSIAAGVGAPRINLSQIDVTPLRSGTGTGAGKCRKRWSSRKLRPEVSSPIRQALTSTPAHGNGVS
jgi:hypothetical protein